MELLKRIFCLPLSKTRLLNVSRNENINENIIEENNFKEILNLNDESDKVVNSNNEIYNKGLESGLDPYEQIILDQEFGLCPDCNQPKTWDDWCKECNSKKFQQNFGNWTSGNEHIDKFIQETQLKARNSFELLEWIPYNQLKNIQFLAQGGFSTVYKGIWLDGWIIRWDDEKQGWERKLIVIDEQNHKDADNLQIKNPLKSEEKSGFYVALKSLNNSSNTNEDFLNEWGLYLQSQYKALSNGTCFFPIHGITRDPYTLNYMIVMPEACCGSLRDNLLIKKYNPNDKFNNLYVISSQLEAVHKLNLVHGDFHDGNILCGSSSTFISDFGLCKQNDIYGVLPYMAPEILCGKPYTVAADIYSFGIVMWEMTSGVPAFHNVPHDLNLSLEICRGKRPEIIEGTMPEYVELIKKCWDNDPNKRPTAEKLVKDFEEWSKKYPIEEDEEKRIHIPENEPEVTYHPESCYTSRKIDYSIKINEILQSDNKLV